MVDVVRDTVGLDSVHVCVHQHIGGFPRLILGHAGGVEQARNELCQRLRLYVRGVLDVVERFEYQGDSFSSVGLAVWQVMLVSEI